MVSALGSNGDDVVSLLAAAGIFVVLIVIVWQLAATWRARLATAREAQYRELAERCAQLLAENAELQKRTVAELTHVREATAAMEKMMREVG
ncbi:hypothetical protein ACWT_0905 [Actinoplanes sp. SE50]|nr:secreted protein [Actinoplanes sp. SE50/110]ATO80320.1 hypothetical protein ACWT_0905 [Actinoplanes sp. SE50]SLL97725.1 hypothetical protein ACSP50_0934 [Actinoplanes sp. SE50/110]